MNVIDYITITCNLKKCPITDYIRLHEKCNRLQPITITNYDYPMSALEPSNFMTILNSKAQGDPILAKHIATM